MRFERNRQMAPKFLNGSDARRVVTLAAGRGLSRARAIVAKRSGETAASGRITHGRGGVKNDRVRASYVFGAAAVQENFGGRHNKATRFMTRALE